MNKIYFLYLLKKHYKMILLLAIISLFFLPLTALTTIVELADMSRFLCYEIVPNIEVPFYITALYSFGLHTVVTLLLAFLIPFFMHNSFYNRNQLDADLALPIKKWQIATTNFVFGVLILIAISLFSFIVGFSIYALKGLPFHFGILLLYFLVTIIIALFMYILVYFGLSFVHTTLDAFMLFGLIMLLPIFFGGTISMNFGASSNGFAYKLEQFVYLFNPIPLAVSVQSYFRNAIVIQPAGLELKIAQLAALGCDGGKYYVLYFDPVWPLNATPMLIIYPIIGGGLSYLTIRRIVTDKAEFAGTKETAPHLIYYGIIIIAFLAFVTLIDFNESLSIFFSAFIITSYFVAMFINARKITINKRILIPFAVITIVAIIFKVIIHLTS